MRKVTKYRPQTGRFENNSSLIFNEKVNAIIQNKENILFVKAGDSWVPVTCEVDERRSYVMLSEGRRPGFTRNPERVKARK